jgi:predicted 3-demethylubiquinone-9 3-methyltransferase (glyoxalase superfamily)
MQKITPFLWFDNSAEEAVKFYTSVFKNSKIGKITRYSEGGPLPAGTYMTGTFQIEGQEFVALNGGPVFKFTEAISFVVTAKPRRKSIPIGKSSRRMAGRKCSVAGSKTSLGYRGKSFREF